MHNKVVVIIMFFLSLCSNNGAYIIPCVHCEDTHNISCGRDCVRDTHILSNNGFFPITSDLMLMIFLFLKQRFLIFNCFLLSISFFPLDTFFFLFKLIFSFFSPTFLPFSSRFLWFPLFTFLFSCSFLLNFSPLTRFCELGRVYISLDCAKLEVVQCTIREGREQRKLVFTSDDNGERCKQWTKETLVDV